MRWFNFENRSTGTKLPLVCRHQSRIAQAQRPLCCDGGSAHRHSSKDSFSVLACCRSSHRCFEEFDACRQLAPPSPGTGYFEAHASTWSHQKAGSHTEAQGSRPERVWEDKRDFRVADSARCPGGRRSRFQRRPFYHSKLNQWPCHVTGAAKKA